MSDSDDPTPFGATVPGPADPSISMPPPPTQAEPVGLDAPSAGAASAGVETGEEDSSPDVVLSAPLPHRELGSEWQFGAGKAPTMPISLPGSRRSIALALVVVLVAAAGAYLFLNRSSSPSGTALALSLTQGQTYRYHTDMTFDGSIKVAGQAAPVSMQFGEDFAWKVESVDASGVATVTMTVESITSTVNGQSTSVGDPMTIQVKVAKDGRILTAGNLALTGGSSTAEGFPGTDQFLPLLPDHPVKPGDSWDKTFDQAFPFGAGKIHYVAHNSYLRNEAVGGVQAAVIGGSVTVPLDLTIDPNEISKALDAPSDPTIPKGAKVLFTGTMNLTQTAWLDLAKHTLLKGSLAGAMDMTIQLKGIPAPTGIPDGKIGLAGNVSLRIQATDAAPAQTPATTNAADKAAQSDLRNALAASKTYFVDHDSYVGLSPRILKQIEPALTYNTASHAKKDEVSIRDVSQDVALLVIKSGSGKIFCLVDDVSVGTVYGTQDPKKAAGCTGGW